MLCNNAMWKTNPCKFMPLMKLGLKLMIVLYVCPHFPHPKRTGDHHLALWHEVSCCVGNHYKVRKTFIWVSFTKRFFCIIILGYMFCLLWLPMLPWQAGWSHVESASLFGFLYKVTLLFAHFSILSSKSCVPCWWMICYYEHVLLQDMCCYL